MRQVGQEQGDSGVLAGCHRQELVPGTAAATSLLLGLDVRPQSPVWPGSRSDEALLTCAGVRGFWNRAKRVDSGTTNNISWRLAGSRMAGQAGQRRRCLGRRTRVGKGPLEGCLPFLRECDPTINQENEESRGGGAPTLHLGFQGSGRSGRSQGSASRQPLAPGTTASCITHLSLPHLLARRPSRRPRQRSAFRHLAAVHRARSDAPLRP